MEDDTTATILSAQNPDRVPKASADVRKAQEDALQEQNKRKELHFKASHGLLITFFLWILYAAKCQ